MKKTTAALAAALVVGTSSTTFAAANPFSDVPAGHWAYQSVAKLAAAGVVEGYGDGTYRGDRNITRYEMAQMVAKAMAKNPTGANKAELDRLAAEFRDELDALGVRVAELEKYADKVIWSGKLEYTYKSHRTDRYKNNPGRTKVNQDPFVFRFSPTMEVNDHWTLRTRIDANADMNKDAGESFGLIRGWAQGNYDNLEIKVGRVPIITNDEGLLWDGEYTGGEVTFGNKFKFMVMGGRLSSNMVSGGRRGYKTEWNGANGGDIEFAGGSTREKGSDPSTIVGFNLQYTPEDYGLYGGASYYFIKDDDLKTTEYSKNGKEDKAGVWAVNAGYKFGRKARIGGGYANNTKADYEDYSWMAQAIYGNYADNPKRGDWSIWGGYKLYGTNTSFNAISWDDVLLGSKG